MWAGPLAAQVPTDQSAYWPLDHAGTLPPSIREWVSDRDDNLVGYSEPLVLPEGRRGRSLEFDGATQSVTVTTGSLFPRDQGSATFWARPNSTSLGVPLYQSDAPDGEPIDYNGFGSDGDIQEIHFGSTTSWSFYYQDGSPGAQANSGGRFSISGGTVDVGRWTHVAATWDRAGDLALYVDCREVARVSLSSGSFSNHTSNQAYFGRPSEGSRRYAGALDEVRVFQSALSPQQIASFCSRSDRQLQNAVTIAPFASIDATPEWFAVGTPVFETSNGDTGAVFLQRSTAEGGWASPPTMLVPQQAAQGDGVGKNMSLDGNTLVTSTDSTSTSRPVWIWEYSAVSGWLEVAELTHPNAARFFGASVALSGDTIALAVPDYTTGGGEVRIVRRSNGGQWLHEQTLSAPATRGISSFVFAVEVVLEQDLLAVRNAIGTPSELAELVTIYRRSGSLWSQEPLGSHPSMPGSPSDMDWNQGRLALGFENAQVESFPSDIQTAGRVVVLEHSMEGGATWDATADISSPVPTRLMMFGRRVALAGDWLAVSARDWLDLLNPVFLYRRGPFGSWRHEAILQPPETFRWGFGDVMHLDSGQLFVGAPNATGELGNRVFQFSLPIFVDGFESGGLGAWK